MSIPKHSYTKRYGEMVGMTIRLPKDLHLWIVGEAKDNHRSLTSQIVNMLTKEKERVDEAE